ncbi:MAG: GDSL-type esterase/lipase family protein [Candidatus Lernaella stagnicola]|nr:GDSL-type esterase/lipase family protein [Candidatus Lernaella stagnicola]
MKKLLFGIVAAFLVLALVEGILRLANYRGDPAVMDFRLRVHGELFGEPDSVRFWRLPKVAPNFRDDTARMVCVSDSVTVMEQGRGWPDRLPSNLMERDYLKPVQVFNGGVPGYTSHQGRLYLETELLDWDPHLVMIQFGWNDHWESLTGVPDSQIKLPDPATLAWQKRLAQLRLYRLIRTLIVETPTPNGTPRVSLQEFRTNLKRMIERVRAQQGKVLLVTAPYLDGDWGWLATHKRYNEAIRAVAAEMNVALVDPVPLFLDRRDFFFWPDTDAAHFNAKGAVVIAGAVADKIVAEKLLP